MGRHFFIGFYPKTVLISNYKKLSSSFSRRQLEMLRALEGLPGMEFCELEPSIGMDQASTGLAMARLDLDFSGLA